MDTNTGITAKRSDAGNSPVKGKIGIVVPAYNAESLIAECIESIQAQTYTNLALVLVDDGSRDRTGKICDEYAEKDSRITVIHRENGGAACARAHGVAATEGCEFITFIDADDTIVPTALQELCSAAEDECDIVTSLADRYPTPEKEYLTHEEYVSDLITCRVSVEPWGKLFRREIVMREIDKVPHHLVLGEDQVMNLLIAFASHKGAKVIKKKLYNYREVEGSLFHTYKRTPESEQRLHEEIMRAIPSEERALYLKHTIEIRLRRYKELGGAETDCTALMQTTFYKELRKDIEATGYRLSLSKRVRFYSTSPFVRALVTQPRNLLLCIKGKR